MMSGRLSQFIQLESPHGSHRRIAWKRNGGNGAKDTKAPQIPPPGIVWISGYRSVMTSTKATYLADWCEERGQALTRFDYSGCGESSGDFLDATISAWLEETVAVIERCTSGPQILIGSSMGGWIALLTIRQFAVELKDISSRIAGLVLIAPAWDMTERLMWKKFSDDVRNQIRRDGVWMRPSRYDDGPYPITLKLIEDGRRHLIANPETEVECPDVPIHILHGMQDLDVAYEGSLELMDRLGERDALLTLVRDGEHRLSRPEDLNVLTAAILLLEKRIARQAG